MSRGRLGRGNFIVAVALSARTATATEAGVVVSCPELSAEDRAQVEARVRANLLSAGLEPASVELSCAADATQTQVTGNGRQVTLRAERHATPIKDALLASADNALLAWGVQSTAAAGTSPPLSSAPLPGPTLSNLAPPAPSPAPAPFSRAPTPAAWPTKAAKPSRAARSSSASMWVSAGLRGELWRRGSGLGGQLGLQYQVGSAFAAIQVGYLVAVPNTTRFSAREVPFSAQLGWQPPGLLGLRGAFGVGLSVFGATPAAGVIAQSDTNSTSPFLGVELSRPVSLGAFELLPELGANAFGSARWVQVDHQNVLALPAFLVQAGLSLALKVGG